MTDTSRQVPSPSAAAWLVDLAVADGPSFVVMRLNEAAAREALVAHLVEIDAVADEVAAKDLVGAAPVESVGVVW
ncbi:MAG TPA: hypothetical protein VFP23_07525 [Solirubrobacterales bacterium]|nr:hypothetical protein [Solirubrobacterales bacterium]